MRILLLTTQIPFITGGAEILTNNLKKELVAAGHQAEIVAIPFKWYPAERILEHILACQLLDITESAGTKIDLVIGLKFPAYLIPSPNKVLWLIHQHRQAYDLWNHPLGGLNNDPNGLSVRDAIIRSDRQLFNATEKIFTISKNVSKRLEKYCNVQSTAVYHPPDNAASLYCEDYGDYFFFPSRLSKIKRQYLILEALQHTKQPVSVVFAGGDDDPEYIRELRQLGDKLNLGKRVTWLGAISDEEKNRHYARCLGVLFIPLDEDYGYVTLEGMLSSKAVITCTDSGGPLEFISHEESGLVVESNPQALAKAMDRLWQSKTEAKKMGAAAKQRYLDLNISWNALLKSLVP